MIEQANTTKKVLYNLICIDDSAADLYLIKSHFAESKLTSFNIKTYSSLVDCIATDTELAPFNALLIEFNLETHGNEQWFKQLHDHFSDMPIIAIVEFYNESTSQLLAKNGIHRVVSKKSLQTDTLVNQLLHSITYFEGVKEKIRTAHYDELTGLANRALLKERVNHAIDLSQRKNTLVALMIIDLDDFKLINDFYGHDIGDLFLIHVSDKLTSAVRASDTVARLGGDEFAVIIEGADYPEQTVNIAKHMLTHVSEPVQIRGKKIIPSISIGISFINQANQRFNYDWLYKSADTALYEAKKSGKNTYSVFTQKHDVEMIHSLELEKQLSSAIKTHAFLVYYQPIFDLKTEHVVAVEALIRWKNSDGQVIEPNEFLTVIEKLGQMKDLGDYVITEVLRQLSVWRQAGMHELAANINISPAQFSNAGFYEHLKKHLDEYDIPAHLIELELTEKTLFKRSHFLEKEFKKITDLGVNVAIDDFGTGYNSFEYLRRFHFDTLKLDQTFIQSAFSSNTSYALLELMSNFANKLNVVSVAEGVETKEQLDYVQKLGVSRVQGFYKSKPMSATAFEEAYASEIIQYPNRQLSKLSAPLLI